MYAANYQGLGEVGLQACRACLATDVKLHNLHTGHLADAFADITKTPVFLTDGLPQHICYICHSQLNRCLEFRERCRQALVTLHDLRARQLVVKTDHIRQMDTSKFVAKITRSEVLRMDCVPEYDVYNQEQYLVPISNILSNETEVKQELVNYEDHIQDYEVKDDINMNICDEDPLNTAPKSIIHEDISVKTEATTNDDEFEMDQDLIIISDDDDIITKIEIEEDIELRHDNHANETPAMIVSQKDLDAVNKLLASKKNVKCNRKMMEVIHDESTTKDEDMIKRNVNKKKNIVRPKKQAKVEKPKIVKKVKRKRMYNQKYIEDYDEFAKQYNIEVVLLSETEQKRRIEERKALADCVKNRLTCEICYKGFMTEQAYKRHMKFHDPSYGKFPCEVCQCRFQDRLKRDRHVRGHRKEFICRICSQKYANVTDVKKHHSWHQGQQYECRYCHRYFKCYNTHANHIRETHTPVPCKDCGESFEGTALLNKHRDTAHTQCQTCNVVFRTAIVLQKHTEEGCRPDNKSCIECGMSFSSEHELNQHREVHGRRGRYKCKDCKSSFTTDRRLGIHWAAVHTSERRNDKRCEDNLSEHERREGKQSEDKSSEDERNVGKQSEAKRSGDEKNEDMQFEDRRSEDEPSEGKRIEDKLCEDERNESKRGEDKRSEDERSEDETSEESDDDDDAPLAPRYVCEVCAGSYKNRISLWKHKRTIHEGHKAYKKAFNRKCPHCDQAFSNLTNLKVHLTYHKGVGLYLCRHCQETFKTYETKTKHIRENHSENCPHKCSMCAELFVTRRHLERHVLHRHLRAKSDPTTPQPMEISQTQSDS